MNDEIKHFIGDKKLTYHHKDIVDCNMLGIIVGTNGLQGGDYGHGSRTHFILKNLASTDMIVNATNDSIEIVLGGDSELRTFIKALEFAVNILKELE